MCHRIKLKKVTAKLKTGTFLKIKLTNSEPSDDIVVEDQVLGANECRLCNSSTQHQCIKCFERVCMLYCSTPDTNSTNEMHVFNKPGEIRCKGQNMECLKVEQFKTSQKSYSIK